MAKELGAEIDKIVDRKERRGILGWLRGGRDEIKQYLTEIEISKDPSKFDLVIVGTPIWAAGTTPAARTYLDKFKKSIRNLAIFTTSGSSGPQRSIKILERSTGGQIAVFEGWKTADLDNKALYRGKIMKFSDKVKLTKWQKE